jgi:hypothetical protein
MPVADDADRVERPAHVVGRLDDAGRVIGGDVVRPFDIIGTDHADRAAALLDQLAPSDYLWTRSV